MTGLVWTLEFGWLHIPGTRLACCCLLLQYLLQSCARGGRRTVEDMRYEIRRAEACVHKSDHHALEVNAGERDVKGWWREKGERVRGEVCQ